MRKVLLVLIPLLFTGCFTTNHFDYAESVLNDEQVMMETSCGYTYLSLIKGTMDGTDDPYYLVEAVDANFEDHDKTLVFITKTESLGIAVYERLLKKYYPYCNLYDMLQNYIDECKNAAPDYFANTKYMTVDNNDGKTHIVKFCITAL